MKAKKPQVYLAMAEWAYEGSCVVRIFESEADATAFVAACNEHSGKKPPAPPIEDTPENDELHRKWWAKLMRWERKHPASGHSSADHYLVKPHDIERADSRPTECHSEGPEA